MLCCTRWLLRTYSATSSSQPVVNRGHCALEGPASHATRLAFEKPAVSGSHPSALMSTDCDHTLSAQQAGTARTDPSGSRCAEEVNSHSANAGTEHHFQSCSWSTSRPPSLAGDECKRDKVSSTQRLRGRPPGWLPACARRLFFLPRVLNLIGSLGARIAVRVHQPTLVWKSLGCLWLLVKAAEGSAPFPG